MKIKKSLLWILIGLWATVFYTCDKSDSDTPWGNTSVYIPQASVLNGGLSSEYPVPFNADPVNKNYEFDSATKVLKIPLGVYRSGLETKEAFSVKIKADPQASATAAQQINRGVAIPEGAYSLPSDVTVESGSRGNNFYLTVDLKKIVEANPANAGKRLTLVVEIYDPTRYELNDKLSKTTVVITARDILGDMNLLKGANMEAGSEQYWKVLHLIENDKGVIEIENGVMTFSNGPNEWTESNTLVYQAFEVEKGMKYTLKADMTSTGAHTTTFMFYIGTQEPEPLKDYDIEWMRLAFWTYGPDGCLAKPREGNLPALACVRNGIEANGTFTAEATGTLYAIFKAQSWGNIGKITIDNISITEKKE